MEDNHIMKTRHIVHNELLEKVDNKKLEKMIKNRLIDHMSDFLSNSDFLKIKKEDLIEGKSYTLELAVMTVDEYKKLNKMVMMKKDKSI